MGGFMPIVTTLGKRVGDRRGKPFISRGAAARPYLEYLSLPKNLFLGMDIPPFFGFFSQLTF